MSLALHLKAPRERGLLIDRVFTINMESPYEDIEWEARDIRVKDWSSGETIFAQDGFRVPSDWSDHAGQIVASKFAFGPEGERETGVDAIIDRVSGPLAAMGELMGYFRTVEDAAAFRDELAYLCAHQYGAFNSPAWFNVGIFESRGLEGTGTVYHWNTGKRKVMKTTKSYMYPQTSACFIQSVDDSMESLMRLATSEAMLFKHGSGTGTDFSTIRSRKESLSTGGKPSGPISFMRIFDQIAATIKSGGKTRRAAKMQTMSARHPDIMDFIRAKGIEERKAHALIASGYDGGINGEAYASVFFQNANFSVRIPHDFMKSLRDIEYQPWRLRAVTTGDTIEEIDANVIWRAIAEETWRCGDPGVQFEDTINSWHTCPRDKTGFVDRPINSSNPCSEYLFQDDSACNLASLRLTKFLVDGEFDIARFRQAVRIFIIAQEILVDMGSYPTRKIAQTQHDFRTLGLGFADLGGLLMSMGLPYDSNEGRALAGSIASLLTAEGYLTSAEMAKHLGPFEGFNANRDPMLRVLARHKDLAAALVGSFSGEEIVSDAASIARAALRSWRDATLCGEYWGFRNAQISAIAPTGTIAFMMDCATTGIEPAIGLRYFKELSGGGSMVVINPAVSAGLAALGYSDRHRRVIEEYVADYGTVEKSEWFVLGVKLEHLSVFDCALAPLGFKRCIPYSGHLMMMAAVQPFISGAISKTVNVPRDFTVERIAGIYEEAYHLGLKCVAIYRDGSKASQPVTLDRPKAEPGNAFPKGDTACTNCHAPILATAGTCAVCPECGTPQGGCS